MDKKQLTGLFLISGLMVAYFVLFNKPKTDIVAANTDTLQVIPDTLASSQMLSLVDSNPSTKQISSTEGDTSNTDSVKTFLGSNPVLDSKYGSFSMAAVGTPSISILKNDKLELKFKTRGGCLVSAQLIGEQSYHNRFVEDPNNRKDLNLVYSDSASMNLEFYHNNQRIETGNLHFSIFKSTESSLDLRAYTNDSTGYIQWSYRLDPKGYSLQVDLSFVGLETVIDRGQNDIPLKWSQIAPRQELNLSNERATSTIYYKTESGSVSRIGRGGENSEEIEEGVEWISFKQQFFFNSLIFKNGVFKRPVQAQTQIPLWADSSVNIGYTASLSVPYSYSPSSTVSFEWIFAPLHFQTLSAMEKDLEGQIDLGYIGLFSLINKYLVIPVFNFFDQMGLNYGIIILLLTLIIKVLLSPLNFKMFVSSAKIRLLKPELDELNAKFKPDEAIKKQQAVMQLYRQAGVNPLAGCLPMLVQMPFLLAMFSFFPSAIELRQQGFLWAEDLSTYDSILNLPFTIPFYGSHVSLFTLLMTATTILYTHLNSSQMQTGANMQQMKIMMYVMPIVFLGVLNSYSAGLNYYYFLSNVVSILIYLAIRYLFIDEAKLRLKMEAHKLKPQKKSKWMQRLEEAQKMREQQVKQQSAPKNRQGRRKS
jgi:YidC/Oxa1 family membrane protein insertase